MSAKYNINNMSDVDIESNDGIERDSVEKYDKERVTSIGNSVSRFGSGEPLPDFDARRRGKERIIRLGYYDDEKKSYTQGLVRRRNHDEISDLNINTPESGDFHEEQRSFGSIPYHGIGPSSYELKSHYEHIERTRFKDQGLYGFARVEQLEHDRVELLWKLDQLKGQLNRSWDMDDKLNERMVSPFPQDSFCGLHNAYAHEGLNNPYGVNKMLLSANELESPYFNRIHGNSSHVGRFDWGMQDTYSPRVFPHEFGGFRPPQQSPYGRRVHHPHHEDVRGYYGDTSPDHMIHQHRQLHRPSCSCEHCCNRNSYVPPKIDHAKSLHRPYGHNINHHPDPILHVSQVYSSGGSPLLSRRTPTLNTADLDYEIESLDGHRHRKVDVAHGRGQLCHPILGGAPFITCCNCFELLKLPRKHLLSAQKWKMKCGSCFSVIMFELGSKSYAVSISSHGDPISTNVDVGFNTADKKVIPNKGGFTEKSNYDRSQGQLDPIAISSISVNKHNSHTNEKSNFDEPEKLLHPLSGNLSILMDQHAMINNLNSDDLEKQIDPTNKLKNDGFRKQVDSLSSMSSSNSVGQHYVETSHNSSLDESRKEVDPLSVMSTVAAGNHETDTDKKSKYGELEDQVDTQFVTPSSYMDEQITDTDQKYDEKSGKQLDTHFSSLHISMDEHIIEDNLKSHNPEMQLNPLSSASMTSEKHYNLPEEYHVHSSDNNISSQFDEGDQSHRSELALDRATTSQISANDSARADVSVNAFSNRHISNYSGEIGEDDLPRVNVKSESSGATNKIYYDTSDYAQSLDFNESKVFVNGHFIQNREVKKAEKLAGPIQPGEYWYDIRAGFWGVMGRPCLGIIMVSLSEPNIEEFNYPLPENCAAGNTGVLVNGRELHQKDLDILASRGLPILKYGSYIIDISGKVVDKHTGEELDSLGKLAPTVEREKRGFGMRVP